MPSRMGKRVAEKWLDEQLGPMMDGLAVLCQGCSEGRLDCDGGDGTAAKVSPEHELVVSLPGASLAPFSAAVAVGRHRWPPSHAALMQTGPSPRGQGPLPGDAGARLVEEGEPVHSL
eukprot:CAMPEP_0115341002 /NCGR_PEP_ID=MMETSP0270-20121206/91447_1 /TAXON_ID=71861 /ORGANISM="Scrippsiella trochoidea, Strain CCMP3099" /LENGTH=116 /DNA_ID=CAMNT_0002762493 /DNA_START=32 /DNA_END=382 /DNA_ORIENTATION=-